MLKLAETNPSDTFVDLGCGDASVLIFAVKNFNIRKAIGYEISAIRYNMALENIRKTHLTNRITINLDDISNANVFEADIIFDMLPESEHIVEKLYQSNIKKGTRLIKHDLPLIGFLADKIDYPFYRMTFPLKKATSKNHWASHVLERNDATLMDLWWELYYYEGERCYSKWDIKRFDRILEKRME